jgi:uncharacterized protein YukE
MDYGKMNEMAAAYRQAAQDMHDSHEAIKKLADQLENGALIGDAGTTLKDAIRNVLVQKMINIERKLRELAGDIQGAVDKMEKGVSTAESRFH